MSETARAAKGENTRYLAINYTDALRVAVWDAAKAADKSPGIWARDILAQHLGVTIDSTRTGRAGTKTEEEKKLDRTAHAELVKRLLAEDAAKRAAGDPEAVKRAAEAAEAAKKRIAEKVAKAQAALEAAKAALEAAKEDDGDDEDDDETN